MKKNLSMVIAGIAILAVAVFAINLIGRNSASSDGGGAEKREITVFMSPTCGCCGNYAGYLRNKGFSVKVVKTADIGAVKEQHSIPRNLESCHTAMIDDYVVEGHIPVEAIEKLLAEKPDITGIALAGMPSGSPGMPGVKTGLFSVRKITSDGEDGGTFVEL